MLDLIFGSNGILIALGGALLALVYALFRGRAWGKAEERAKQDAERIEAITEAQKIDAAIAGRDPDANRKELGKWSRK
jgi:uncharacterized protein YmfQ (DUF2313 family)